MIRGNSRANGIAPFLALALFWLIVGLVPRAAQGHNALDFDGDNDYVNAGNVAALNGLGELTIEAWARWDTLDTLSTIAANRQAHTEKIQFGLGDIGNTDDAQIQIGSDGTLGIGYTTGNLITTGVWYHLAAVFDGAGATDADRLKIYVNGMEQALTYTGTIPATTDVDNPADLIMGAENTTPGGTNLDGRLEEVRVWSIARGQAEIQATMNEELLGSEPGLVAYYRFNHGVASGDNTSPAVDTVVDDSGNGHDGTLANFALTGASSNWVTSDAGVAAVPFVVNVTATDPDGAYLPGDSLDITVQFSEVVTVGGTPRLLLETGASDALVDYAAGSGTDTLTFTYVVVQGDSNLDLDYPSTAALTLNGGTIQNGGFNADLTLPTPGAAGSLGANKALEITCAANPVVTTDADSGLNSLRWAMEVACVGDTITFDGDHTITLATDLYVLDDLTIDGETHAVHLDGNYATPILYVIAGQVDVKNLIFENAVLDNANGAALYVDSAADVILDTVVFQNNAVTGSGTGGAIFVDDGVLQIYSSLFLNNDSQTDGGAIAVGGGGSASVKIFDSDFSANTASGQGGALRNELGTLYAISTTLYDNTASGDGGGVANSGVTYVLNSTLANNSTGVYNDGTLHLKNALIAASTGYDCSGALASNVNNWIQDNTCAPALSGDPLLGAYQDNGGGDIYTLAPLPESPVVNAGDNAACADAATVNNFDARGVTRPQSANCTIGAHEKRPPAFASTPITMVNENIPYGYAITTTDNEPLDGASPVITASTLPTWLTFSDHGDGTATLSGIPSEEIIGAHDVLLSLNETTENVQQAFTIVVASVNDAPSFTASPPPAAQSLATGPQTVSLPGWATFAPGGGVVETGQGVAAYLVTNLSNASLFAAPPTVATDGTLSYQIATAASGSATFEVAVQDDGGTSNGGVDTSPTQTFTIDVTAPAYTLQIRGVGSGRINSSSGLDCALTADIPSGTCDVALLEGTPVSLHATAEPGMAFAAWSGDCAGQAQAATLVLRQNSVCEAEFKLDRNLDDIPDEQQAFILSQGGVTLLVEGCASCVIDALATSDPGAHAQPDTSHNFQGPLATFQISGVPLGGTVGVKIQYEGLNATPAGWVYRKFGPLEPGNSATETWFTQAASFTTKTLLGQPLVEASLSLTDGQLGDDSVADGIIRDPGAPALARGVIGFDPLAYTVSEDGGGARLTVTRVGGSDGALSVAYASVDETAVANADFTPVSGTLDWASGDTTPRLIDIPILDDPDQEETETFSVVLSGVDVDGLAASAQIAIGGNDYGITLTPASVEVNEGGSAMFTLARGVGGGAVTVHYATQDGSALADSDYPPVSGDLTWAAGESGSRAMTVNVVADNRGEPRESFFVVFSGGLIASAEVFIAPHSDVTPPTGPTESAPSTPDSTLPDDEPADSDTLPEPIDSPAQDTPGGGFEGDDLDAPQTITAEQLADLPVAAFPEISPEILAQLPADSFSDLSPEQFGALGAESISVLSLEQFAELPAEAVSGLTEDNLPALPWEIIEAFTTDHVDALSRDVMNELDAADSSNLMVYLDLEHVDLAAVERIVPADFEYNPTTGDFLPPPGSSVTPRATGFAVTDGADATSELAGSIIATKVMDMNSNLSVGGNSKAPTFQEQTEVAMITDDLQEHFSLRQDQQGILQVEGKESVGGISFAFIPDLDKVTRLPEDEEFKIGLGVDAQGFYHITLPNGIRFQVTPSPKNYQEVNQVTGATDLYQGDRGEIMLSFADATTRRRGATRAVAMFEPLIEPPPGEFCIEVIPGEPRCDFTNAPAQQRPGIHLASRRRADGPDSARIVYPDGSSQQLRPTVLDPEAFLQAARATEGVESADFLVDGTLLVVLQGQPYRIRPNFQVESEETDPDAQPTIAVNPDGTLRYTLPWAEPSDGTASTTRRRARAREALVFTPAVEPIPDEYCVRVEDQTRCDFQRIR